VTTALSTSAAALEGAGPSTRPVAPATRSADADRLLDLLSGVGSRAGRLVHVEQVPERPGMTAAWQAWVDPDVRAACRRLGMTTPWAHQAEAADLARAGRSVIVSTGTASGKSLAYLLPALTAVREGLSARDGRGATAVYLSPTKALAGDQLRVLRELDVAGIRAATYDGDTPTEERDWVRAYANVVLTNPDMLHRSVLPGHQRWATFLRSLRFVVIDECHVYRGLFGSHVSAVVRRLRRVCAKYGSEPVFVLASATVCDPAAFGSRLLGLPVEAVTTETSPRGRSVFALWEPPLTELAGEHGAPVRRSAHAEAADLLTDLVLDGCRTLAFVRSRRGAETVAMIARRDVEEVVPGLGRTVAAYRGGYLPEERRALEHDLQTGDLVGVAATSALELGLDVSGLDAVLLAGWPGTRASMWQQAGRAGREGQEALAVLIARDDPLDTYLVHHPAALFGAPIEATVLDPANPYVLAPHLAAAAAEIPLTDADWGLFGPTAPGIVDELIGRGLLRRRPAGIFWTDSSRACDLTDLRGTGGPAVRVVEGSTGRVLGTVDGGGADRAVHAGAVYVHQGATFLVDSLDLVDSVALVEPAAPDYTTFAREITDIRISGENRRESWGPGSLVLGEVDVTSQVVSFLRRRLLSGEVLGEQPLDLPRRQLHTRAVWWTLPADRAAACGIGEHELPGAAHAAEHASIGLLPLFGVCDRWDIGGVSTALHPDTGLPTVFVYDGCPGGAGFAERGFEQAAAWLTATRDAIADCGCDSGCPSCVQSPKCGNGNDPLDKDAAVKLLTELLRGRPVP
jgi:DEAD/DEAH box helicase domain-containing protein